MSSTRRLILPRKFSYLTLFSSVLGRQQRVSSNFSVKRSPPLKMMEDPWDGFLFVWASLVGFLGLLLWSLCPIADLSMFLARDQISLDGFGSMLLIYLQQIDYNGIKNNLIQIMNQSTLDKNNPIKKKIKGYTVSFCPKEFLGRSLYGEVRMGIKDDEKKVYIFRINSLPISTHVRNYLNLQEYYGNVKEAVSQMHDIIETQSNRYTVMEYYPKTFRTELSYFRKLTKNLEPFIEKFFQAYSQLYYLRINHGNISLENIGITFDGKVKLMDFRPLDLSFEEGALKDYRDFRNMLCFIMERDKIFPLKFEVLDDPNGNWQKLFSAWHTACPYEYLFLKKKMPHQNIAVLMFKLENNIYEHFSYENEWIQKIRIALRLLLYSQLQRMPDKSKKIISEIKRLEIIMAPIQKHDVNYYNGMIWGMIKDVEYFGLNQSHRLALICCCLENLNHEYCYIEILREFNQTRFELKRDRVLADSLMNHYAGILMKSLISLG